MSLPHKWWENEIGSVGTVQLVFQEWGGGLRGVLRVHLGCKVTPHNCGYDVLCKCNYALCKCNYALCKCNYITNWWNKKDVCGQYWFANIGAGSIGLSTYAWVKSFINCWHFVNILKCICWIIFVFWLKVQFTKSQHWCRWCLGASQYLNQWWCIMISIHWRIPGACSLEARKASPWA